MIPSSRPSNWPRWKLEVSRRGWWNKFAGDLLSAHAHVSSIWLTHPSNERKEKEEGQGERARATKGKDQIVLWTLYPPSIVGCMSMNRTGIEKTRTEIEDQRISLISTSALIVRNRVSRVNLSRVMRQRQRNVLIMIGIRNVYLPPLPFFRSHCATSSARPIYSTCVIKSFRFSSTPRHGLDRCIERWNSSFPVPHTHVYIHI